MDPTEEAGGAPGGRSVAPRPTEPYRFGIDRPLRPLPMSPTMSDQSNTGPPSWVARAAAIRRERLEHPDSTRRSTLTPSIAEPPLPSTIRMAGQLAEHAVAEVKRIVRHKPPKTSPRSRPAAGNYAGAAPITTGRVINAVGPAGAGATYRQDHPGRRDLPAHSTPMGAGGPCWT